MAETTDSAPESPDHFTLGNQIWKVGDSHPLQTSILFVDLVSSSAPASILDLEAFADYSRMFERICERQCAYFFERRHADRYAHGSSHYEVRIIGDELAVFLYSDRPHEDVAQLISLALALKCAWLCTPLNAQRARAGLPTFEIAIGIHSGPVWATYTGRGFEGRGYAINLAKRVEAASREGDRYRIFLSDPAMMLINRRVRKLIFGQQRLLELRGMPTPVGLHELTDCFIDPVSQLEPDLGAQFLEIAESAISTETMDLWIHSSLQVARFSQQKKVSEGSLELCRRVLHIDPKNAVALFFAAEGEQELGHLETSLLYLEDLTSHWPTLGDGWLERARLHKRLGELEAARRCILQARRHGVRANEEKLPRTDVSED